MYEIPTHIKRAIDQFQPVEVDGLTLYPITVRDYDDFMEASPAVSVMQQSLPVTMLSVPLLTAYYRMALNAIAGNDEGADLFYRAVLFLAMALRVGEGLPAKRRAMLFTPVIDKDDPSVLKCLRFTVNGEETQEITPVRFQRLRPILAAQNGIELISEDANPELVEAEREINQANGPKLHVELADEISFVAALSHTEEREIYDWPILKLQRREKSYTHLLQYVICGAAEAQGTKWKDGNPFPHPYYERIKRQSAALKNLQDVASGAAAKAVENPGQKIS